MRKSKSGILFLLLVSVLLGLAFQLTDEQKQQLESDPRVLGSLDEKVKEYRRIREKICQDDVLERANEIVDSMLLDISRQAKLDTLLRPPRPDKPLQPEILAVKDSEAIAPLWNLDSTVITSDSLLKDSLKFY